MSGRGIFFGQHNLNTEQGGTMGKLKLNWKYLTALGAVALALGLSAPVQAAQKKPNIVVIWGDDVGYWNVSAYNQGMMGYETPNIDSVAKEGALFTDWYAQQSCTAGRAALLLRSASLPYRAAHHRYARITSRDQ